MPPPFKPTASLRSAPQKARRPSALQPPLRLVARALLATPRVNYSNDLVAAITSLRPDRHNTHPSERPGGRERQPCPSRTQPSTQAGLRRRARRSRLGSAASYRRSVPESERPKPTSSFTTSTACRPATTAAADPSTPPCAQEGSASAAGASGKRQRRQGCGAPRWGLKVESWPSRPWTAALTSGRPSGEHA